MGLAPLGPRRPAVPAGTPDLSIWIQPVASQHLAGNLLASNQTATHGRHLAQQWHPYRQPRIQQLSHYHPSIARCDPQHLLGRVGVKKKDARKKKKCLHNDLDGSITDGVIWDNYHSSLNCVTVRTWPGFRNRLIPTNRIKADDGFPTKAGNTSII